MQWLTSDRSIATFFCCGILGCCLISCSNPSSNNQDQVQLSPLPSSPRPSQVLTTPTQQQTSIASTTIIDINPAQSGILISQNQNSQIRVYRQPTVNSVSPHYGIPNDPVSLLKYTEANDQYRWYFVEFNVSRVQGWIRGDFIQVGNSSSSPPVTSRNSVSSPVPSESTNSGSFSPVCSSDTSNIRSLLSEIPTGNLLANTMIASIGKGKQAVMELSSNPNCETEKKLLAKSLEYYWSSYIRLDYQKQVDMAGLQKSYCLLSCSTSDGASCEKNCAIVYQQSYDSATQEQQFNIQEMNGFFSSIR